jgi:hypothetical protein
MLNIGIAGRKLDVVWPGHSRLDQQRHHFPAPVLERQVDEAGGAGGHILAMGGAAAHAAPCMGACIATPQQPLLVLDMYLEGMAMTVNRGRTHHAGAWALATESFQHTPAVAPSVSCDLLLVGLLC